MTVEAGFQTQFLPVEPSLWRLRKLSSWDFGGILGYFEMTFSWWGDVGGSQEWRFVFYFDVRPFNRETAIFSGPLRSMRCIEATLRLAKFHVFFG